MKKAEHRRLVADDTLFTLMVVIGIFGVLICLLLPAVWAHRGHVYMFRYDSRQIGIALRNYSEEYGTLPPIRSDEQAGRPAHSWRVLILPQLGYDELYAQYSFDEPWDSPNNLKLLDQMPSPYAPSDAKFSQLQTTSFQAVVGPNAAWPETTPLPWGEIAQRASTTALVVECEDHLVPWTAPHDLTEDEAIQLLVRPPHYPKGHWSRGLFTSTCYGRILVKADGETICRSLSSPDMVRQFLYLSDARPDPLNGFMDGRLADLPWRIVHYATIAKLAVLVLVALWPVVWLRPEIRRTKRNNQL